MQVQPEPILSFESEVSHTTLADDFHDGLNILPKWCNYVGWFSFHIYPFLAASVLSRIAHERAEQLHDLNMIPLRVLGGEAFERVDAAQAHR